MAGGRVGADGGADVGDSPSMHPGRHGRWDSEGVLGVVGDGREFVWLGYPIRRWKDVSYSEPHRRFWRERLGCARYFAGEPLPPPRAEDVGVASLGFKVVHLFDGRWRVPPLRPDWRESIAAPIDYSAPAPVQGLADGPDLRGVPSAPQGGGADVSRMSHRVWQDYGTDGTRRWPRWWCSCGAHGQGWPSNHPDGS